MGEYMACGSGRWDLSHKQPSTSKATQKKTDLVEPYAKAIFTIPKLLKVQTPWTPYFQKEKEKKKKKNSIAPSSFSSYYALIFSFSAADWRSTLIFGYLFFCR